MPESPPDAIATVLRYEAELLSRAATRPCSAEDRAHAIRRAHDLLVQADLIEQGIPFDRVLEDDHPPSP